MILGIGTDLVDRRRVKNLLSRQDEKAVKRLMTPLETHYYKKNLEGGFAKTWAGKEAIVKALGGMQNLTWHDFEIRHHDRSAPTVFLSPKVLALLEQKSPFLLDSGTFHVHISFSDEPPYVLAFCVLEGR
ncbi:holo-[acyl-carrier-protein] synthase [Alphaproteobacteria bacterium]|nr:holo-[acyl-carrier-protein] synthase [Alphaproteobacteria bacterium]GHS98063.1 holo-[acyl-carrier-protein] synthase [Alphaproteobacteria bacterium]